MKFKDTGEGGDFAQCPPGTYAAVCTKMIDLGQQRNEWQGVVSHKRQVFIAWELSEKTPEGKPFQVAAFLTQSLHEKATLRKYLEAWRGRAFSDDELRGFDPRHVLGTGCMLSITQNQNGKAKVSAVAKLMHGVPVPQPSIQPIYFSLEQYDENIFSSLGNGIRRKIEESPEFQAIHGLGNGQQTPQNGPVTPFRGGLGQPAPGYGQPDPFGGAPTNSGTEDDIPF